MELIVGALLSLVMSMVATLAWHAIRRPQIVLKIVQPPLDAEFSEDTVRQTRFLLIELVNKPLPDVVRWLRREPALSCHGTISFYDRGGQRLFVDDMPIIWTDSRQPLPMRGYFGTQPVVLAGPETFLPDNRLDAYPGEPRKFHVAVRFNEETDCYGFTYGSYFAQPKWRLVDYRLKEGVYLVGVRLQSSGEVLEDVFRLVNTGNRKDFRLEAATEDDRKRTRHGVSNIS